MRPRNRMLPLCGGEFRFLPRCSVGRFGRGGGRFVDWIGICTGISITCGRIMSSYVGWRV